MLAFETGIHDTIGIDLVNFLDYWFFYHEIVFMLLWV
jgi:hypothetical protein